MKLSRRSFFMLPMLAPLRALSGASEEHQFHFDHVIGTSMDLAVWLPRSADSPDAVNHAAHVALAEVQRLSRILSTYDSRSEISLVEREGGPVRSTELAEVFSLYRAWQAKTCGAISIRPRGAGSPLNVDALGKAYIIDRTAEAIRRSIPRVDGLLLNIGGDIVVWGRTFDVAVTNPARSHDNAEAMTSLTLKNQAVATSGSYARGAHLIDARTGEAPAHTASATVFADDAVTANALATMLCVAEPDEALALAENTPGAEAIRIAHDGLVQRTSGFARRERFQNVRQTTAPNWPAGYEVSMTLTLIQADPRMDRSYVGFWVEDLSGKLVRTIVLWGNKKQYHPELTGMWKITAGNEALLYKVTRATRAPGNYKVVWNGLDDQGKPVPRGTYRIVIETNRWHGEYAKAAGTLVCESEPASVTLAGSVNYEPIRIQYGPKPNQV